MLFLKKLRSTSAWVPTVRLVLCFISFVLVQVKNNTFYWLFFIIYRPEFADWSKTFLKVFLILWYLFWNFSNACCNWTTYIFWFQFFVKQMFVVIAEAVPHRCSCIWSIPVINVRMNNFINTVMGIFLFYTFWFWSKSKFSQIRCIILYF